jgi:ADP-heptose:LPS heptosyltransferase
LALSERAAPMDQTRTGEGKLVIQLARLGDFLQTTPLLAALGRPDVLVTPAQAPLAHACRHRGRVMILDPATLEDAAQAEEPDRLRLARMHGILGPFWREPMADIYNLNLSALCASLAKGWPQAALHGWRWENGVMAGEDWSGFMMGMVANRRLTRLHLTDILASYAAPKGPPLERLDHRVEQDARQRAAELLPSGRPLVALQLGANNDLRRWPVSSFAMLAQELRAQGAGIAIVGSSRERVLGRRLKREMGPAGEKVSDLMGITDLLTLAAVLEASDLVISADTGTLHLATAVCARVLALYMGPAQVHETGPYGQGHLVLQARDQCGPCQESAPACKGKAPCRKIITPWIAQKASLALLQGSSARRAAWGLDLPDGLEALAGELDGFGQRYIRLSPQFLSTGEGLALALREAGRILLRPNYKHNDHQIAEELEKEYKAPPESAGRELAALAHAANRLSLALEARDGTAVKKVLAEAPGLRALGGAMGDAEPAGLSQACQAASAVLEMSAGIT